MIAARAVILAAQQILSATSFQLALAAATTCANISQRLFAATTLSILEKHANTQAHTITHTAANQHHAVAEQNAG
jgi:hypothetical protein